MLRLIGNGALCGTLLVLCALALAAGGVGGGQWLAPAQSLSLQNSSGAPPDDAWLTVVGTPTLPPDPWETEPDPPVRLAGKPTLPPDPWETEPDPPARLAITAGIYAA